MLVSSMISRILRVFKSLDIEDRILNSGCIIAIVGVFLPWISGEFRGAEVVTHSGFEFFTSFLGTTVFLLHGFLMVLFVLPLAGGPNIVRKRYQEVLRLFLSLQATLFTIAALSVLTVATFEYRMEVRFGIYVTLIGSVVVNIYAFLRWQAQRRKEVHDLFHHPEDPTPQNVRTELRTAIPLPPVPQAPSQAEDHHPRIV